MIKGRTQEEIDEAFDIHAVSPEDLERVYIEDPWLSTVAEAGPPAEPLS